jgi:hypothetical protein
MIFLHPLDRLQLTRGAEHLHRLGARPTAEFLAELGNRIGGLPAIFALLVEYEQHLDGGDRRRPLHVVPLAHATAEATDAQR